MRFDEYAVTHGMFTATEPGFTNAFPGGNCALRVADALSVGGFDERYRGNSFREESDLSLRMAAAGQLIYYEPRAVLTILPRLTAGSRVKTHIYDNFGFYKNELFFTLRAVARPRTYAKRFAGNTFNTAVPSPTARARRRRLFFWAGLLAASWRVLFGRRVVVRGGRGVSDADSTAEAVRWWRRENVAAFLLFLLLAGIAIFWRGQPIPFIYQAF